MYFIFFDDSLGEGISVLVGNLLAAFLYFYRSLIASRLLLGLCGISENFDYIVTTLDTCYLPSIVIYL